MYITEDGLRLNATLDMPVDAGEKCPLVIVIHGFTGHSEERHIVAVSEALNEIGFATLRVDMYGHGDSDGQFHDHTLFKWLTNALAVFDWRLGDTYEVFYLSLPSDYQAYVYDADVRAEYDNMCKQIPLIVEKAKIARSMLYYTEGIESTDTGMS